MKKLTLQEIINVLKSETKIPKSDILYIQGISTDSREDQTNKLYIPLKGASFDGHDFINQALNKGAIAALSNIDNTQDHNQNVGYIIKVKDTTQALIDLASYYRSLFNIKIVGITGSVGKTTAKDMIASVLGQQFNVLKTKQNLNNEIGVSKTILDLNENHQVAVIEMGMSDLGEISQLSNIIKPDIGLITNIGLSHIETLENINNILKAKLEILDGMKERSLLILNGDDKLLNNYNNPNYQLRYFSINNQNYIHVKEINFDLEKTNFKIVFNNHEIDCQIPCFGIHNIYSALSAYIIGHYFNLSDDQIKIGLSSFKPSGMRQKIVNYKGTFIIEDCYNASPDSMKAAISTLAKLKISGDKIMVISDMLELGLFSKQLHYNIGAEIALNKIDQFYCFGNYSQEYVNGARSHGMAKTNIHLFKNKSDLYHSLKKVIKPGNLIWFKASRGMKLEEILERIYKNME